MRLSPCASPVLACALCAWASAAACKGACWLCFAAGHVRCHVVASAAHLRFAEAHIPCVAPLLPPARCCPPCRRNRFEPALEWLLEHAEDPAAAQPLRCAARRGPTLPAGVGKNWLVSAATRELQTPSGRCAGLLPAAPLGMPPSACLAARYPPAPASCPTRPPARPAATPSWRGCTGGARGAQGRQSARAPWPCCRTWALSGSRCGGRAACMGCASIQAQVVACFCGLRPSHLWAALVPAAAQAGVQLCWQGTLLCVDMPPA